MVNMSLIHVHVADSPENAAVRFQREISGYEDRRRRDFELGVIRRQTTRAETLRTTIVVQRIVRNRFDACHNGMNAPGVHRECS